MRNDTLTKRFPQNHPQNEVTHSDWCIFSLIKQSLHVILYCGLFCENFFVSVSFLYNNRVTKGGKKIKKIKNSGLESKNPVKIVFFLNISQTGHQPLKNTYVFYLSLFFQ